MKKNKGITLIALVITIIVLLILAGVTIATLTGENGILNQARSAAERTKEKQQKEQAQIDNLTDLITESTEGAYVEEKGVNMPKMLEGMTRIMFTEPTKDKKGEIIKSGETGFEENNWYDYNEKRWANAMTEDGSMWVWIPRFAYKITKQADRDEKGQATGGGTIDVKFLIGTSNDYYDENGERKTAKRARDLKEGEVADTEQDYYVHPAFTDESNLRVKYENGGWREELTGIWVAKFEAGYPQRK